MKNNIAIVRVVETNVVGIPIQIATVIIAIKSIKGFMTEMKIIHPIQIHLTLYLIQPLQSICPLDTHQPP